MLPLWLFLAACTLLTTAFEGVKPQQFCDAYVECAAVATLEERLCLGNSRLRPYWLPQSKDKYSCHEKLLNDYIMLEKMEKELDDQLATCLLQKASSAEVDRKCSSRTIQSAPRFSYGRTIEYVPTHCFTGRERRIDRECGSLRSCCPALKQCVSITTDSPMAKQINDVRIEMRQRAKNCENGIPITVRPLPAGYTREESFDPKKAPGGYVNVRINDASSGGQGVKSAGAAHDDGSENTNTNNHGNGYDQSEGVSGEVSRPIPDSVRYSKAKFSRIFNRPGQENIRLINDRGSLTLSAKPKLSFPGDEKVAIATDKGVLIVHMHNKEREAAKAGPQLPASQESHDEAFKHALANTIKYKAAISSGEAAREAIDSLLKAGQASENTGKVASTGPVITGRVEPAGPKASGSIRQMQMIGDDDDDSRSGDFVTTGPVIFVGKNSSKRVLSRSGACVERIMKDQAEKLQTILTLLGEKRESDDMREIKELIDQWHNQFRHKVISAKEKASKLEISKALSDLIHQFDRVNLELIKSQVNATFDDGDYPDDDAEVFETKCDPLLVNQILDETLSQQETAAKQSAASSKHKFDRVDGENNDEQVVIEDGVEKLMISGDGGAMGMSIDNELSSVEKHDVSKPSSDKDIISNWSNEDYKRELEKYKKEHYINGTLDRRNETSCDLYMRCRNQMHLAVDSCAWRFASSKILPSLAESAESLLYRAEELCDPSEQPLYEELYELMIRRNGRLRDCLDKKNDIFFSSSLCIPYSSVEHIVYSSAFIRLLSEDYKRSADCYRDANLIQEKCTKLRECCPNFDSCRQQTMDITLEQAIISKTARLNADKQDCLKTKAREAFKVTLRGLLGKVNGEALQKLKRGELSLDVVRGAQVLARFR